MRRTGTIGFVFLWLLTLANGPLSALARVLPVPSKNVACAMGGGKRCCCGAASRAVSRDTRAAVRETPQTAPCHCTVDQAPLVPTDSAPRLVATCGLDALAPAAVVLPDAPLLRPAVSPHVGTLAPPLLLRPRVPDSGRAPPASF